MCGSRARKPVRRGVKAGDQVVVPPRTGHASVPIGPSPEKGITRKLGDAVTALFDLTGLRSEGCPEEQKEQRHLAHLLLLWQAQAATPGDPQGQGHVRDVRAKDDMKLVEVTWEDALRDNRGWDSAEAYREGLKNAPLMRSVGYLLVDDPAYTVLIQSHDSLDGVADALRIPRGMVREIRELRVESAEQG